MRLRFYAHELAYNPVLLRTGTMPPDSVGTCMLL
jgi:hypothetical protein